MMEIPRIFKEFSDGRVSHSDWLVDKMPYAGHLLAHPNQNLCSGILPSREGAASASRCAVSKAWPFQPKPQQEKGPVSAS
jgi:hypothetical protein